MAKYDDNDGVWRTIGGRRIFIKDGEDLKTAMKNSGKFKIANKKEKDEHKIKPFSKEDYEERDRRLQKRVDEGLITKEDAEYEKLKQAWTRDEISREEFDREREKLKGGYKETNEKVGNTSLNLSQKQINEGNRLAQKSEDNLREDLKNYFNAPSSQNYFKGKEDELIRELANEHNVDLEKTKKLFKEESIKNRYKGTITNLKQTTNLSMQEIMEIIEEIEKRNKK